VKELQSVVAEEVLKINTPVQIKQVMCVRMNYTHKKERFKFYWNIATCEEVLCALNESQQEISIPSVLN